MLDGYYLDTAPGHATSGFRALLWVVEESMEMVGVIIFIFAQLDYAGGRYGVIELVPDRRSVRVEPATEESALPTSEHVVPKITNELE